MTTLDNLGEVLDISVIVQEEVFASRNTHGFPPRESI